MPSLMIDDAADRPTAPPHDRGLRRLLMATLVLGILGVSADLLLHDHIESSTQIIPLGLLGLTVFAVLAHAARRSAATVRILQMLMCLFLICGPLGTYLHFQGNSAFQIEMQPDIDGLQLLWKSLRAKAPPALAPLAFVQLGLVGLAWSFRHPLLRTSKPALSIPEIHE